MPNNNDDILNLINEIDRQKSALSSNNPSPPVEEKTMALPVEKAVEQVSKSVQKIQEAVVPAEENIIPPEQAPVAEEISETAPQKKNFNPIKNMLSGSAESKPSAVEEEPAAEAPAAEEVPAYVPEKPPVRKKRRKPVAEEAPSDEEAEEESAPSRKKKKKKKKKSRLPFVLILTTLIFAVSICLSLVIIFFGKDMLGIGKSDTTHMIVIEDGATTDDVVSLLEQNGIIKSPECFKLFAKISNNDAEYIPGEHFIRPNMAYETILKELTSVEYEKKTAVEVTFPEGINLYDAAVILEDKGVCSKDDFMVAFNSGDLGFSFESMLPAPSSLRFYPMEGYLFPDTYYFYQDMDPEQVCQKIYMNFDEKMTDERIRSMEKLGLDMNKLVTFASIVQKEAADFESMNMVASVFWNRLNNPKEFPKLQSDPTKNYSERVIKPHIEVYDQVIIDAYDTYVCDGLPPGPICNPGVEAIDAVLAAQKSEYFYFIANVKTGITYYSVTDEEHEFKKEMIEAQYAAGDDDEEYENIDEIIREYENGELEDENDEDDEYYEEDYNEDYGDENYSDENYYDDGGNEEYYNEDWNEYY